MQPADKEPLTKAIVFSHLWTHSQLIEGQLRGHGVNVALFKGNMKPEEKAASLRSFKVDQSSREAKTSRAVNFAEIVCPCHPSQECG